MKHRLSIPATFKQIAARISLALVLSIAGFFATPAGLVQAASIYVTTTADDYGTGVTCSLREAITAANNDAAFGGCSAGSGADTIFVQAGTYTLTRTNSGGINEDENAFGDLDINANLTITGAGSGSTIIQAGFSAGTGIDKVLAVNPYCINPVNAVIDGVTIRYGRNTQASGSADFSQTGGGLDYCGVGNGSFVFINSVVSDNTNVYGYGGGMNVDGITGHTGSITIDHVTFSNNQTLSSTFDSTGGALNLFGYQPVINITNSTFQNNSSPSNRRGGAIHYRPSYGGSLQVNNSIFINNSSGEGGALALITTGLPSPVTIQNSLISGNIASGIGIGGGISSDRTLTLVNNTITANSAGTQGGGIANYGTMTMGHTTISGNSAPSGAGIYNGGGTATLINSIIANHAGPDCTNIASLNASDHTLIEDNTCSPSLSGVPLLSAMGTYGGVTQTMALLPGSKAIDAGGNSGCTLTDQRGVARPIGSACDIGAFESNGFTLGSLSGSGQSATINNAFTNPLGLTVTANNAGEPVNGGTVTFTPPGSGASAAISGSPATISGGTASVTATANGTAGGPYNVAAITPGVSIPVNFALTNTPPQLSINDVSANEGNSGTTTFTFTVSLPAPAPAGGVTFDIATANGTALIANSDYVGLSTTGAAITAGNTSTTFIVTVNGDHFNEGDENFYVNISNVNNVAVLDGQGVGTIVNDDTSPDPMVINFSATSPSTTVDIPITVFTAFDDVAITGYMITSNPTAPGAGDSGWTGTAPSSYSVSADGSYTLYPWVKDADGHVSALFGSPVTVLVDTTAPTAVISSSATDPTHTSPIPVTITFSEPVCGFDSSTGVDLNVTNGTTSALTSGSNGSTVYTFNMTPGGQGLVSVFLLSGSVFDGDCVTPLNYNNSNSATFSITYDTVSPTVTIEQAVGQGDPTNATSINFTATFSDTVTGFTGSDVNLSASTTTGTLSAVVTGSGTTYNVAVSGMTADGAVISSIPAGAAQDAAGNPNTASSSVDNSVSYISGPLNVTVNQATGQNDPTNSLPVNFTIVFSRPINTASFTPTDVTLGGTAPGSMTAVITEIAPNNGTTFNISVSGMTGTGTVTALIAASRVQDLATINNDASTSSDNSVKYDPGVPTISGTNLKATLSPGPNIITVKFNEAVYDNPLSDIESDDVTNPNNYFLLEKGANGVSERNACNVNPQPPSDDVYISIDHVDYDNATFTATLSINGGIALPLGNYELFVCGTTSIVDLAGNEINNGISDYTYNFRVIAARASLPATGFAPDRVTILPAQPENKTYGKADMWLEIPALGIKQPIVGIPKLDGWDVSWLGNQIGYLNGTAYPTWAGNSVLTGHVTNSNGDPGPFAQLGTLKWGDRVIIHAFGQEYIYEIRSVERWTNPKDTKVLEKHEELPWVSMITCTGYDAKTGTYRWRTVVRAVQIRIDENSD